MKRLAQKAFHKTLAGIDIGAAIERHLDREGSAIRAGDAVLDLRAFRRIWAIAYGKASVAMAEVICPGSCAGVPCRGHARGAIGAAGGARLADVYGRTSDSTEPGALPLGARFWSGWRNAMRKRWWCS